MINRLTLVVLVLTLLFLALVSYVYSQTGPVLSVTGTGSSAQPGQETVYHLQLLNHTDQIVYNGVLSITLPAGFTYVPNSTLVSGHGWPISGQEPRIQGQTLSWGPYHLPAAGVQAHNPYGIHTLVYCDQAGPGLHLEGAKELAGSGGYVTQLFYSITPTTTAPSDCAVNFVQEAYARNLIPIIRLGGISVKGIWQAPDPGPKGDYAPIAQAVANFVAGLPRRDTNPLYIQVWNEPDLWIEWSNRPDARAYGRFFVAVSQAIRRLGDARIRVVNGALTPGNPGFLERMLQVPGFRDAFDVWASHCYPYNHPPSYNNHDRTARYGTYTIDCYLQELAIIERHGRGGVKVMVTETGYELGNNTFGFEGMSRINEGNRALYISTAFSQYWQNWPEVVAATPFELTDATGHWVKFDWLSPTPPYLHRPQFNAVAALPKPAGNVRPYGYQVTFRARVGAEVKPGLYPSRLSGSDEEGHTALAPAAAPVRVYESGTLISLYLPLILKPFPRTGPWYLEAPSLSSPGAIIPSHFLRLDNQALQPAQGPPPSRRLPLSGEPVSFALHEAASLGLVGLSGGRLELIDLAGWRVVQSLSLGQEIQSIVAGSAQPALAYASLEDGVALIDLKEGQVMKGLTGLGRLRGLAWDEATRRLFVADATHERLLVFQADLSTQLAEAKLNHPPDQIQFDPSGRRLYLSLPAAPQVAAIEADTLKITAQASVTGGPLLELALAADGQRLYALNALTPRYRGLTIWQLPALEPVALVAGSEEIPFYTAASLALTPGGQLLLPEGQALWQINPEDFTARHIGPVGISPMAQALEVAGNGQIYWVEPGGYLYRVN